MIEINDIILFFIMIGLPIVSATCYEVHKNNMKQEMFKVCMENVDKTTSNIETCKLILEKK